MVHEKKWHIIHVKSDNEKKFLQQIKKKGIEGFYLLGKRTASVSIKNKSTENLLLKRNVFVFADISQFEIIKKAEGYLNFIYWLNNEVTITTKEACLLKEYANGQLEIKVEKTHIIDYLHYSTNICSTVEKDNFLKLNQDEIKINIPSLGYQFTVQLQLPKVQVIEIKAGKDFYKKTVASL